MTITLKFVEGNTREGIECELINPETGESLEDDLVGATAVFHLYSGSTLAFSSNCAISGNTIEYTPTAGDFDRTGTFSGEFLITFLDSTVGRIHDLKVVIEGKSPIV